MTWTAIIYHGHQYSKELFYGSHDRAKAFTEAQGKFNVSRTAGGQRTVVIIIPGENPVYIHKPLDRDSQK